MLDLQIKTQNQNVSTPEWDVQNPDGGGQEGGKIPQPWR